MSLIIEGGINIGGGDVLTFNYSTPTITKTTNVTGKVFYNSATNGF